MKCKCDFALIREFYRKLQRLRYSKIVFRYQALRRLVESFFQKQTRVFVCNATHGSHRCGRPNGHFGKHWCQCHMTDGTEWT